MVEEAKAYFIINCLETKSGKARPIPPDTQVDAGRHPGVCPRHRIGVEVVTAITKTMRMFQETAVSTNSLKECDYTGVA
ncbi:MAG: hypothetical protein R6X34_09045 [Chloroflexota bacterium]